MNLTPVSTRSYTVGRLAEETAVRALRISDLSYRMHPLGTKYWVQSRELLAITKT